MINPRKVSALSRKKLFEQSRGRDILKLRDYYEKMPVWNGMALNAASGLLLFIMISILAILAEPDWFTEAYYKLGNVLAAVTYAISMAVFTVIYSVVSDAVYRIRFRTMRSTLCSYTADLRQLEKLEREQDSR